VAFAFFNVSNGAAGLLAQATPSRPVSNAGTKKDEWLAMGGFYYDFLGAPSSFYGADRGFSPLARAGWAVLQGKLTPRKTVDELPKVTYRFGVGTKRDFFGGSRSERTHEADGRG
jgi:hypothetical protein